MAPGTELSLSCNASSRMFVSSNGKWDGPRPAASFTCVAGLFLEAPVQNASSVPLRWKSNHTSWKGVPEPLRSVVNGLGSPVNGSPGRTARAGLSSSTTELRVPLPTREFYPPQPRAVKGWSRSQVPGVCADRHAGPAAPDQRVHARSLLGSIWGSPKKTLGDLLQ